MLATCSWISCLETNHNFHFKVLFSIKTLSLLQWTLLNCDVTSSKYKDSNLGLLNEERNM